MRAPPQRGRTRTTSRVSAIVLAAGRSLRMGLPKPLVRVDGQPLLERVLATLAGAQVSEIVIVLGHEASLVKREIRLGNARVVVNPDYLEGMSTSIRTGLHAADPSAAAYLIVLGDQPFVASTTLDALVRAWRRRGNPIVIPSFRGRRGNPVLVDRLVAPEIDSITGDLGFRALFAKHAAELFELAVDDPGILFDVDTADQVSSLERKLGDGVPLKQALTDLVAGEAT